jgi:hypothetical protein
MAKRSINKSQAVRDLLGRDPSMSARDVVNVLAARRIRIKPQVVYGIKARMEKMRHSGRGNAAIRSRPSVEDIYAVWELGHRIGMSKLREIVGKMPG